MPCCARAKPSLWPIVARLLTTANIICAIVNSFLVSLVPRTALSRACCVYIVHKFSWDLPGMPWGARGAHGKSHGIRWESLMWGVTSIKNVKQIFFFLNYCFRFFFLFPFFFVHFLLVPCPFPFCVCFFSFLFSVSFLPFFFLPPFPCPFPSLFHFPFYFGSVWVLVSAFILIFDFFPFFFFLPFFPRFC